MEHEAMPPHLAPPAPPPAPPSIAQGFPSAPFTAGSSRALEGDEFEDEVETIDDLIVKRVYDLGPDDPPPSDLDDDDESHLDEDASSMASEAMPDVTDIIEYDPPAEDHSVQRLIAHTEPVFAVAVNPAHPEILATGGGDDVGYLWRVGQPQPAFKLEGHSDTVSTIAFSADGSMLASGSLDGSVRVWHVPTGALAVALEGPTQGINWICWHVRGAVLLAGSEDATAWMWKLPEGSVMQIFSAHSASVSYGCFVNNGRSVLTGSEDGSVRVWNPRTGTVEHCLYAAPMGLHEPRPITCLAAHPAQPVFMFGSADGGLKLAHAESGKTLAVFPSHDASVEFCGFCDVMALAASCGMDGKMCIWDLGTFSPRHTCMHTAGVIELRWLKGSPMILTCALSREIRLWDGRSGECLQTLTGHHEPVLCFDVGYTTQGIYVVSGSDDKTARLWQPRL
jgi:ribosome assembly protein SQT1|eukprot:jgi/Chrpa1/19166/Chrysochromulina_OHIO_Genome00007029-RA